MKLKDLNVPLKILIIFHADGSHWYILLFRDRTGWIPKFEEFSLNLASQYGWVYGLSVTEMEIVHGAMRKLNPNGIYMKFFVLLP